MYNIPCRCGKTKKQFKNNIGTFYIEKCCEIAGYDVHGNKPDVDEPVEVKSVEVKSEKRKYERKNKEVPEGES